MRRKILSKCTHEACQGRAESGGYCLKHYNQFRRHGKTFERTARDCNEIIDMQNGTSSIIILDIKLVEKGRIIVDSEDVAKILDYKWNIGSNGYAVSTKNRHHKSTLLHHLILHPKDGMNIDHRDGDRFNNIKSNLRHATKAQNAQNREAKGVYWLENRKRWQADLTANGKRIYLGRFKTCEEALEARVKAMKTFFGEFMHNNNHI